MTVTDGVEEEQEAKRLWEGHYRQSSTCGIPWGEDRPSAQLVELVESSSGNRGLALDMGTGSGDNAIYLAQHGFGCSGLDISETAVRRARDKAARVGVFCEFTVADATRLPYADNTFALVFDRGCFHSISLQQRGGFVNGVHRVLKPRGKYLLICFGIRSHRRFDSPLLLSSEDIRGLFAPFFKINRIEEIADGRTGVGSHLLCALLEKPP